MFILKVLTVVLLVLCFILVYSPICLKKIEKTVGIDILELYSEYLIQFIISWTIGVIMVVLMLLYAHWIVILIYDIIILFMLNLFLFIKK